MKENGFHKLENEFPLARNKAWFPLMSVMVSASRKKLSSKVGFHYKKKILLQ